MILVRNVFQIKFGKMKEVLSLWRDGQEMMRKAGQPTGRLLTDITGTYYTFVLEMEYESLDAFEKGRPSGTMADEWSKFYARFCEYVVTGHREILSIVVPK